MLDGGADDDDVDDYYWQVAQLKLLGKITSERLLIKIPMMILTLFVLLLRVSKLVVTIN